MPSYVYSLKLLYEPYIKIGKSSDPISRIRSLPHTFNLAESAVFKTETDDQAYGIEKMLHKNFSRFNVRLNGNGGTEFFNDLVARDVHKIFTGLSGPCGQYLSDFFLSEETPFYPDESESSKLILSIANKCKSIRLSKNISQSDISEVTKIAGSTYKKFEQTGEISLERLVKVLIALNDTEFIEWANKFIISSRARAR